MTVHVQIASQFIPFRSESAFINDSVFSSILLLELVYLDLSVFLWSWSTWVSPYFCDTVSSSDVGSLLGSKTATGVSQFRSATAMGVVIRSHTLILTLINPRCACAQRGFL